MTTPQPTDEVTGAAPPEKNGRLDTNVDELEPELDDEVAKELREFEQLQNGLRTTDVDSAGAGDKSGTWNDTVEQGNSGSDMELDHLENEISEARKRDAAIQVAGERKQVARTQQQTIKLPQPDVAKRPVMERFEHGKTDYRVLPDNFAEENLRGDDLIEKSNILGDDEERCLDIEGVRASEKFEDTCLVDPLKPPNEYQSQHKQHFEYRNSEPSQSRFETEQSLPKKRRADDEDPQQLAIHVGCLAPQLATNTSSPRNQQQTDRKLQPAGLPVTKEPFQGHILQNTIRPASPQPSTSKDVLCSASFVPKEAFVDPVLKTPSGSTPFTSQDFTDPIFDRVSVSSQHELEKAPSKILPSGSKVPNGRIICLQPRADKKSQTPLDQHHIRAMDFDQPAKAPYRPRPKSQQTRPNMIGNSQPQVIEAAPLHRQSIYIPPRTSESSLGIHLISGGHQIGPSLIPNEPKHPSYLDFLEKSKTISHMNQVSTPAPASAPLAQTSVSVNSHTVDNTEYCIIEHALQRRFVNCFEQGKFNFIGAERPKIWCPEIYPYLGYYESQTWLAACNELKKFFCWPCLCFSSKGIWSVNCNEHSEYTIGKELVKHKQSLAHQESMKQFEEWKIQDNTSVVTTLLKRKLEDPTWKDQQQEDIVKMGRPCPVLNNEAITFQSKTDKISVFKAFYDRFKWACGCKNSNRFYCWPCLVFTADNWSYAGAMDSHSQALLQHEMSPPHMSACLKLGKTQFELKKKCGPQNEAESEMQSFLECLVEVFCAEKKKIDNIELSSVDYVDSLHLLSSYNKNLRKFLEKRSKASKTAVTQLVGSLSSPILNSVEFFIKDEILKQIKNSNFVSLIFDHSSGLSNKAILSVIVRYVDTRGKVYERFVKLLNVGYNSSFSNLCDEVLQVITELQCQSRLVGYTYDGYLVKPGNIPEFNAQVRKLCPNARFFHYTEHSFLRILKQALSHMPLCRHVFQVVQELADFLDTTPNAASSLATFIKQTERKDRGCFWKSTDFVKTVFIYHVVIVEIMQSICSNTADWKVKTVVQASNFLNFFKDPTNRFFVTLLARIYNTAEVFMAELDREVGIDYLTTTANNTVLKIEKMGQNFDNVVESACSHLDTAEERAQMTSAMSGLRDQFSTVIRAVVKLIQNRTAEMGSGYFKISKETSSRHFIELKRQMLTLENVELPSDFNPVKLSAELKFFHDSSFLSGLDLPEIVAQINDYNMIPVLPELFKFVQLALAVPKKLYDASTVPAVKRMAAYMEGKKDLNSTDALIWMEKDILTNLQKTPKFFEKVATRIKSITKKDYFDQHSNELQSDELQ